MQCEVGTYVWIATVACTVALAWAHKRLSERVERIHAQYEADMLAMLKEALLHKDE